MFRSILQVLRPNNPYSLQRTISGIGPKYYKPNNDITHAIIGGLGLTSFGLCVIKWTHDY